MSIETPPPSNADSNAIALVGLAVRFPGARTVDAFWQTLCAGRSEMRTFSEAELATAGVPEALRRHPDYVPVGTTLPEHDRFDPAWFGLSPRDARQLDPQHRVLLECAVEALDDAGYGAGDGDRPIGVFAGAGPNHYRRRNLDPHHPDPDDDEAYRLLLASDGAFLTTRIAYLLDLKGPAVTVQTTCSTSLVAVHMACQSLLAGECDMALAGGVSLTVPQTVGYLYREGMIASPDGQCRAFDAGARGTVGGNGAGLVVLKRLDDARADGDAIRAVIRGSAINNDGGRKVSYTAPSVDGQAAVIREAHAVADVDPETITCVEAHGTGTVMGDPIEVAALTQAFATARRGFCALGSVKTNIGHADCAAGIAGLVKATLALEHRQIPASLHFDAPNPAINFAASPFYVNTALAPWPAADHPRRAGVSSFGVGGTNAHAVLEEAPARGESGPSRPWQLVPLSAKTPAALERAAAALAGAFDARPGLPLPDAAYTLAVGRRHHPRRRFVVASTLDGARGALLGGSASTEVALDRRPVAFMLPGQGAQSVGMGRALYANAPVFRDTLDRCADRLCALGVVDLRAVLYPPADGVEDAARQLRATSVAQPALFAISYALAAQWRAWGVTPAAMIGHSVGEYVAATLAGVFELDDALALITIRGALMQAQPPGAMLAVAHPADAIEARLADGLALAARNGPALCVVSGANEAIDAFGAELRAEGIECKALRTSHAFHSPMMDGALAPFAEAVAGVTLRPPKAPFISNVTGDWITDAEATSPAYWARHLRAPVRFDAGLTRLGEIADVALLEVGPGRVLTTLARGRMPAVQSMPAARASTDGWACLLGAVGRLWSLGAEVDLGALYADERRHRVSLPASAFERQRCWIDPPAAEGAARAHADITRWFSSPSWQRAPLAPGRIPAGHWLIHCDARGIGAGLADRLTAAGQRVTPVEAGEDLAATLRGLDHAPDAVVCLWPLIGAAKADADPVPAVLAAIRALAATGQATRLMLVGDGLMQVLDEPLRPEKAALPGLLRVMPQEHPHVRCRVVDIAPDMPRADAIDALLAELACDAPADVAWRGRHRWRRTYAPLPLPAVTADHRGRVYLITGGLGRIGRALAGHLITHGARVALVGRSAPPDRAHWPRWMVTHGADDPTSAQIVALRALDPGGDASIALAADVADPDAIGHAIEQAERALGPLSGVMHAAAEARGAFRALDETGPDDLERQRRPKAAGLRALDDALGHRRLALRVVFSSISTVLGGLGLGAYAAANAELDALASSLGERPGGRWLSIAWDGWAFDAVTDGMGPGRHDFGMTPAEGIDAFERAIAAAMPDGLVVSTGDLDARRSMWAAAEPPAAPPASEAAAPERQDEAPRATPLAAPEGPIEETIAGVWCEVLGVARVGRDDDFWALGGHSLLGAGLITRIRRAFGVAPTLRALFDDPTVAGIARAVDALARSQAPDRSDERPTDAVDDDDMEEGFL